LGLLNHEELGVPKNLPEAYKWAQRSAQQGNPFGSILLGGMYEQHEVPSADPAQAQMWIAKGHEELNRLTPQTQTPQAAQQDAMQQHRMMIMGAAVAAVLIVGASRSWGTILTLRQSHQIMDGSHMIATRTKIRRQATRQGL
jgi:hypothetical protein